MKKTIHLLHNDLSRMQTSRAEYENKLAEAKEISELRYQKNVQLERLLANPLDWRKSTEEKPDMAMLFLTIDQHGHVFRWNPELRGPLCWEVFTHWAYFNPPVTDPAEVAWKAYAKANSFHEEGQVRSVYLAAWKAAKESK